MSRKITTEDFINRSILKHGDYYNYSKIIYKGCRSKVIIICPDHGEFEQKAESHLRGSGCPKCADKTLTTEEFIKRANLKHSNLYDYSKVVYKNYNTKITIICHQHGEFKQTPRNHLQDRKCIRCYRTLTTDDFIKNSNLKHSNFYDYSKVVYKNSVSKVIIICPEHGEFEQIPSTHLQGSGCTKCSFRYSKISINWINYVQFLINKEIQNILSPSGEYKIPTTNFFADGYCKDTNTIYEFHGDFWHGNPEKYNLNEINPVLKKSYRELYEKTQSKKKKIMELGYNYVEIWEYDWRKILKSVIKIQRTWRNFKTKKWHLPLGRVSPCKS